MNKNWFSRVLAFLLALVLLIGCMSFNAFAGSGESGSSGGSIPERQEGEVLITFISGRGHFLSQTTDTGGGGGTVVAKSIGLPGKSAILERPANPGISVMGSGSSESGGSESGGSETGEEGSSLYFYDTYYVKEFYWQGGTLLDSAYIPEDIQGETPERIFDGWVVITDEELEDNSFYENLDENLASRERIDFSTYIPTEDVTFSAVFKEVDDTYAKITYCTGWGHYENDYGYCTSTYVYAPKGTGIAEKYLAPEPLVYDNQFMEFDYWYAISEEEFGDEESYYEKMRENLDDPTSCYGEPVDFSTYQLDQNVVFVAAFKQIPDLIPPSVDSYMEQQHKTIHSLTFSLPGANDPSGIKSYTVRNVNTGEETTEPVSAEDGSYWTTSFYGGTFTATGLETDQEYTFEYTVKDMAGNTSEPVTFTGTPGLIQFTVSPEATYTIGGLVTDQTLDMDAEYSVNIMQTTPSISWRKKAEEGQAAEAWNNLNELYVSEYGAYAEWDLSTLASGLYEVRYAIDDHDGGISEQILTYTVDNERPGPVRNLSYTSDLYRIMLTWDIPEGPNVSHCTVQRREYNPENPGTWSYLKTYYNTSNRSYTDTNVSQGKQYEYRVIYYRSVNSREIAPLDEDIPILLAELQKDETAPEITTFRPEKNSFLQGNVNTYIYAQDNVKMGRIVLEQRIGLHGDWTEVLTREASSNVSYLSLSTTIDTAKISAEYGDCLFYLRAKAYDAAGNESEYTTYSYTLDNTAPSSPSGLAITGTATTATITWEDVPEDDRAYFVVEMSENDGAYNQVARVRALGAGIGGLTPGNTYTFRVRCEDQHGNLSPADQAETISFETPDDTTAPVVTYLDTDKDYLKDDVPVKVQFIVQDDYDVDRVLIQVSRNGINYRDWVEMSGSYGTITTSGNAANSRVEYRFEWTLTADDPVFADLLQDEAEGTGTEPAAPENGHLLADGPVYIRVIPTDSAGNEGDNALSSAPFTQVLVDYTAPEAPVLAQPAAYKNTVSLSWTADENDRISYFKIYRGLASDESTIVLIKDHYRYVNYYDEDVVADTEYTYYVTAVDDAGNESVPSILVRGGIHLADDKTAPQIVWITPKDGQKIGGKEGSSNRVIDFYVEDDTLLSNITATYTINGNAGTQKTVPYTCTSYYYKGYLVPDLSGCKDGDLVNLTIEAEDASGNKATQELTLQIDLKAPQVEDLKAEVIALSEEEDAENGIRITFSCLDEDAVRFYVDRLDPDGNLRNIGSISEDGTTFEFVDEPVNSGNYQYKIRAYDSLGNSQEYSTGTIDFRNPHQVYVKANLDCGTVFEINSEASFSAAGTWFFGEAAEYAFDFGDGSGIVYSTKPSVKHTYTLAGTYTVTLTATDKEEHTDSVSVKVKVRDSSKVGTIDVLIIDDTGTPVNDMTVYFDAGGENEKYYTNSSGHVLIKADPDTYNVGAYKEGWLPVMQQVVVEAGKTVSLKLKMTEEELVTGTFDVKRMTLEEIIAAGIDLADPANQHTMNVTIELHYSNAPEVKQSMNLRPGETKTFKTGTRQYSVKVIEQDHHTKPEGGSGGGDSSEEGTSSYTVAVLEIPIEATILKEFFRVKLHLINNADESFTLTNNCVGLNIPEGMTLMERESIDGIETAFDELKGQETHTLDWIIRGDKAGDYQLQAVYRAILSPFDEEVFATFESPNIHVYGTEAVQLIINLDQSIRYQTLYMSIGLKNAGDYDMNFAAADPLHIVNPGAIKTDKEGKYATASLLDTWVENDYGAKVYALDNVSRDVERRYLAAGETLYRKYAIHGVTDDEDVLYFRNAILKDIKNLDPSQIIINIRTFDLYEAVDSDWIMKRLSSDEQLEGDLEYLLSSLNFAYIKLAGRYSEPGDIANHLLRLEFEDVFDKKTRKEFIQGLFTEIIDEVSVENLVNEDIDAFRKEVGELYAKELEETYEKYFGNTYSGGGKGVQQILEKQIKYETLSRQYMETGDFEAFEKGTQELLEENGIQITETIMQEVCERVVPEVNEMMSNYVQTSLDTLFGTISDIEAAWTANIEAFNNILTMKAASREASYLLDLIANNQYVKDNASWIKSVAEEVKADIEKSAEDLQRQYLDEYQKRAMAGEIAKNGAKAVGEAALQFVLKLSSMTTVGKIVKVLKLIYSVADKEFGMTSFYNSTANADGLAMVSDALAIEFGEQQEAGNNKEALHVLKYLVACRLAGERFYATFADDWNNENLLIDLYGNKDMKYFGYQTVDEFTDGQFTKITTARDNIFNYKVKRSLARPAAPVVTFNYTMSATDQAFSSGYEYSLDGGESWIACSGEPISVPGKETIQYLRVRVAGSYENFAGEETELQLSAVGPTPAQIKAARQSASAAEVVISQLAASESYDYFFSDDESDAGSDWALRSDVRSFVSSTIGKACVTVNPASVKKYLIIRKSATIAAYATKGRYVLLEIDSAANPTDIGEEGNAKVDIATVSVTGIENLYANFKEMKQNNMALNAGGKELLEGTDYYVTYANNIYPGTATITITGIGGYKGTRTERFKIFGIMEGTTVSGIKNKTYTGKKITQSLTVKFNDKTLVQGTDYTVSYKNNKAIGEATVTITGKGNYLNTIKKTFKINPAKAAISSLKAGKKKATIKVKALGGGVWYQVAYRKKGTSKWKYLYLYETIQGTIKKLKSKKTYEVKVRAGKDVKKTTYYGAWSSVKKVKIK